MATKKSSSQSVNVFKPKVKKGKSKAKKKLNKSEKRNSKPYKGQGG
jgi:hypothetical protein